MLKLCLITKPMFQLCHIQIPKNAIDKVTLVIMHDITLTYHTNVNLCKSVHEFCMELKEGCIGYELMVRNCNFSINVAHMNI
jgi:hypothetical protein